MDIEQLFAEAQDTLRRTGTLRFATLYIDYIDVAGQSCLNMCVLDMPESVQEQIAFLVGTGRQFGQQHPQAELQVLALVTEAWVNTQEQGTHFVQPADDPQRREVVWVEEMHFLTPDGTPHIRIQHAAICRDTAGQITGLATPEVQVRPVRNSALATFVRGFESASLSASQLVRQAEEFLRGRYYGG